LTEAIEPDYRLSLYFDHAFFSITDLGLSPEILLDITYKPFTSKYLVKYMTSVRLNGLAAEKY
jgi:hypothetical protein